MLKRHGFPVIMTLLSAVIIAFYPGSPWARSAAVITFPQESDTPAELCGECHGAIYREYLLGIGSDSHDTEPPRKDRAVLGMPAAASSSGTAHAGSGLACVGCHLTKEGKIRAVHKIRSAHEIVVDPTLQSSSLCGRCHGLDETGTGAVGAGKTYLEWQRDYLQAGLGTQQCQDCHMPRTMRQTAEGFDLVIIPPRIVGRHLWTGAHSRQRLQGALSLTVVQQRQGSRELSFHVANIGAGHSVPTGPARRAVYLRVEVLDGNGKRTADKEWIFAASGGEHPNDKASDKEKKNQEGAGADRSGGSVDTPQEPTIRAGEERVLNWKPALPPGEYTAKSQLRYTLDRFAEHPAADDTELVNETFTFTAR